MEESVLIIKELLKIELSSPTTNDGLIVWRLPNSQLHRKFGPAIEQSNGSKAWYLNGLRHREDGPALEHSNGYKEWYLNGLRHREDGPAIEHTDGSKEWYLNGKLHRKRN